MSIHERSTYAEAAKIALMMLSRKSAEIISIAQGNQRECWRFGNEIVKRLAAHQQIEQLNDGPLDTLTKYSAWCQLFFAANARGIISGRPVPAELDPRSGLASSLEAQIEGEEFEALLAQLGLY
jgi:hypothetical protein